jgi:hypothetical protein
MKALLTALLLLAGCGGGAGASLRFETAKLELGTMHSYEEREFALPFTIEGSGKVRVDVLDTSCGCTDVRLVVDGKTLLQAEKDPHVSHEAEDPEKEEGLSAHAGDQLIELAAGSRGEVRGTYRPEKRTGDQYVAVTIAGSMLNSPAKSQIHAQVKPVFVVASDAGNFKTVSEAVFKAGALTKEFTVQAPQAFQVKFWKGVPENLMIEAMPDATVPAPDGAGVQQKFRLSLKPNTPIGTVQLKVTGETSLGPAPLDVTVAWRVLGQVNYMPEKLVNFQNRASDQDHEMVLKLRPTDPDLLLPKPKVEILDLPGSPFRTAVEELTESDQGAAGWLVRITLPKGTPAETYKGTLRISYPADSGIAAKDLVVHARVQVPR